MFTSAERKAQEKVGQLLDVMTSSHGPQQSDDCY